jgi:hypothetical protein
MSPDFTTATRLPEQALSNGHHGARGNGNGHGYLGFGGNRHAEFGKPAKQPVKKTRRSKPHIKMV